MDPEHERIIRIGLSQLRDRGFVLGGSQAFNEHGLGTRQAHDVDLFTDDGAFDIDSAVADAREAYESAGYQVDLRSKSQHFARMTLTGSDGRQTELDMGLDYRDQPPVEMDFGPALHVNDSVGCKLRGIYDRGAAKDYLDMQDTLDAGWSRERILAAGDALEVDGFDRDWLAGQLSRVSQVNDTQFAKYGASPERIATVRSTMTNWGAEMRARQANPELDRNLRLAQSGVAEIGQGQLATAGAGAAERRHSPYERGQDGPYQQR